MLKGYRDLIKRTIVQKVKGAVSVHTINGLLVVDIVSRDGKVWRYIIEEIQLNISTEIKCIIVAKTILEQYRQFITSQYFR